MIRLAPLLLLCSVAWANPKASRHPLPNREVERPVVLPRSWTELGITQQGGRTQGELRFGLAPRIDLAFRPRWQDKAFTSQFEAGFRLSHREAPAGSTAVRLQAGHTGLPFGGATLVARQQLAGVQIEAELGAIRSNRWLGLGRARLLLQAGPIAGFVRGALWSDDRFGGHLHAGGLLNPTRGLDLEVFGTLYRTEGPDLFRTPAGLGGRITGRF